VTESGAIPVVHCCAPDLPLDVLRSTPVAGVSFDVGLVARDRYDDLGAWLDSGRSVWLGVLPTTEPAGQPPTDAEVTADVLAWWRDLGYSDVEALPDTTVTPTCGLAGTSPSWARTALGLCQRAARNLSVEQGRMEQ